MRKLLLLSMVAASLPSCTYGWIYNDTVAPYCTDMRNTPVGERRSDADIKQISIPRVPGGRVLWDSNTIAAAAKEAGIQTVQYCDRHQFSVLGGLWAQDAIVVYGNP